MFPAPTPAERQKALEDNFRAVDEAADRAVLNTVDQALHLASAYSPEEVGAIFDVFHIWWDPELASANARAACRIYGFHVSDWLVPLPDTLLGRGLMEDGVIDNRGIRALVEEAGYTGPIEVEIFNRALWDADPTPSLPRSSSASRNLSNSC